MGRGPFQPQKGRAAHRWRLAALVIILLLTSLAGGGDRAVGQEEVLWPPGPWLLYSAADGLMLANLDGSARTLLALLPPDASRIQVTPNPSGSRFLLATQTLPPSAARGIPPAADLRQFVLPGGGSRLVLGSLLPDNIQANAAAGSIFTGLNTPGQPTWSPSGDRFAFTAGHEGTPDLYVYLQSAGVSLRLTQSTSYPDEPAWSANGRRLVWAERQTDGWTTAIMMASFASASGATQDIPPWPLSLNLAPGQGWVLIGWQTADRILFSGDDPDGAAGLFVYDCRTASVRPLLPADAVLRPPAYDPASDTAAFIVPETSTQMVPGLYRLDVPSGTRTLVQPGDFSGVTWAVSLQAFLVEEPSGTLLLPVDPALPITPLPQGDFRPAPDGRALAILGERGDEPTLSVLPDSRSNLVFAWNGLISGPAWSPDGQHVYFVSLDPLRPGLMQVQAETGARTVLDETATGDVLQVIAPHPVTVLADIEVPLCASPACDVITATLAGDESISALTGRSRAGDRLAIRLADGREGWVASAVLTTSLDVGGLAILGE